MALFLSTCSGGFAVGFVRTASSDVAKLAFAQVQTNPAALKSLGQPLKRSYLVFGDLETHGSKGEASLSLTIYGSRGRGKVYADAVRLDRSWQLISLDLAVPGRPGRLNLMPIQSTVPR